MNTLEKIRPQNVFRYFAEISQIPRGSYHTKEISDYLAAFAKEHGFTYCQDEADNVIIIKEASKGYETAEPVILQGHIDMVCEKEADCEIDFEKEGLDLYVDGDFLKARGTTLGADDGIAIAYILAILDDDSLCHPKLEAVLTSDEEVGLLGAKAIDVSMLKGRILINLDSEEEGHFLTSCAGGLTARAEIPVAYRKAEGIGATVQLHGLLGGHSGSEIDKEHANAIIEMGRLLKYIEQRMPFGLASLEGGLKDNAIPREVSALLLLPEGSTEEFLAFAAEITKILQKEYAVTEPALSVTIQVRNQMTAEVLTPSSLQKVLFYLCNVPNGVMHMSTNIKGLVETSLNAGVMKLGDEAFCITSSVRSSIGSRKQSLADRLSYLAEFLGGTLLVEGDYPAWEYRADSKIRTLAADVYRRLFAREPVVEAIHAGLECGLFCDKIKDLDAVSFGPDTFDIHTPKERLSISSAERTYRFLVELLGSLK